MTGLLREMQYNKIHQWTLLPSTLSSWLCLQLFLHLVFIQSGMLVAVMGLRLESISVPQSGIKGNSVLLGCEYQLDVGDEKLYSLKWYMNGHEFFRYMPDGPNLITTFNLPGVQVDSPDYKQSNVIFKLMNLRLSSEGTYKCEISLDAPTFKTLSKESNLSVIVLPNPPLPQLDLPRNAQLGERIRGNCTYRGSYPPAKLTFYVNDVKVNNSEDMRVKIYEPREDKVIEDYHFSGSGGSSSSNGIGKQYQYQQQHQQISSSSYPYAIGRDGMNNVQAEGSSNNGGGLKKTYTSVSGIEFRLDRHYFLRRGHVVTIRCMASVVDQMWDIETNVTIHNLQTPQLSTAGHNRYSSGSEYLLPFHSISKVSLPLKPVRVVAFAFIWMFIMC